MVQPSQPAVVPTPPPRPGNPAGAEAAQENRNGGVGIVVGRSAGVRVDGLPIPVGITGSDVADLLFVDAQAGNDTVDIDDDVEALITAIFDLGPGQT